MGSWATTEPFRVACVAEAAGVTPAVSPTSGPEVLPFGARFLLLNRPRVGGEGVACPPGCPSTPVHKSDFYFAKNSNKNYH